MKDVFKLLLVIMSFQEGVVDSQYVECWYSERLRSPGVLSPGVFPIREVPSKEKVPILGDF